MYRDITEIRQFYQSALGRKTAKILRKQIRNFWPEKLSDHQTLVGVGYPIPYLQHDFGGRNFAAMTATQGVIRWPTHAPGRTVLTEDNILPFAEGSIDRLLLVHAVENAEYLRELMHEAWRVLAPNGRLLMIVPNRAGVWARSDKTPFGYGRPYSMKQIRLLLREAQFVIDRNERALFFMPSHNRFHLALAFIAEKIGPYILPQLGGVIVVEASKQLYNVTPVRVTPSRKDETSWQSAPIPAA
jgi:SAM-dependent methyltransferase